MTIRFSCHCGAQFEVSDDKAGLVGRCRNCGEEMTIPQMSPGFVRDTPDSDESLSEGAHSQPTVSENDEPLTETNHTRYCPFCGHQMQEDSAFCPSCRGILRTPEFDVPRLEPLTPIDWALVTFFAPVGFVLGFVSLVTGNRKGLSMIGISTASMFLFWLVSVVLGWFR